MLEKKVCWTKHICIYIYMYYSNYLYNSFIINFVGYTEEFKYIWIFSLYLHFFFKDCQAGIDLFPQIQSFHQSTKFYIFFVYPGTSSAYVYV